jgi:hypothetical protein
MNVHGCSPHDHYLFDRCIEIEKEIQTIHHHYGLMRFAEFDINQNHFLLMLLTLHNFPRRESVF